MKEKGQVSELGNSLMGEVALEWLKVAGVAASIPSWCKRCLFRLNFAFPFPSIFCN
jgi:hypothetical protein